MTVAHTHCRDSEATGIRLASQSVPENRLKPEERLGALIFYVGVIGWLIVQAAAS